MPRILHGRVIVVLFLRRLEELNNGETGLLSPQAYDRLKGAYESLTVEDRANRTEERSSLLN